MGPSSFTIVGRTVALSLALLLVMTGCGQRSMPPVVEERCIIFDFTPADERCGSLGSTAGTVPILGSSGGVCDSGGWGVVGSFHHGGGRGGDGRAALIVMGVIIAVVVMVVVVDLSVRGVRAMRGTDHYLRLVRGSRQVSLSLCPGVNRLRVHQDLVDGIVSGNTAADILVMGRCRGRASFIPHLAGDELKGW